MFIGKVLLLWQAFGCRHPVAGFQRRCCIELFDSSVGDVQTTAYSVHLSLLEILAVMKPFITSWHHLPRCTVFQPARPGVEIERSPLTSHWMLSAKWSRVERKKWSYYFFFITASPNWQPALAASTASNNGKTKAAAFAR